MAQLVQLLLCGDEERGVGHLEATDVSIQTETSILLQTQDWFCPEGPEQTEQQDHPGTSELDSVALRLQDTLCSVQRDASVKRRSVESGKRKNPATQEAAELCSNVVSGNLETVLSLQAPSGF